MSGRNKGSLNDGSVQHQIAGMKVGDVKWVETTVDGYKTTMRQWNLPINRRCDVTKGYVMRCRLYQALPCAETGGPVVVLVRVERMK